MLESTRWIDTLLRCLIDRGPALLRWIGLVRGLDPYNLELLNHKYKRLKRAASREICNNKTRPSFQGHPSLQHYTIANPRSKGQWPHQNHTTHGNCFVRVCWVFLSAHTPQSGKLIQIQTSCKPAKLMLLIIFAFVYNMVSVTFSFLLIHYHELLTALTNSNSQGVWWSTYC